MFLISAVGGQGRGWRGSARGRTTVSSLVGNLKNWFRKNKQTKLGTGLTFVITLFKPFNY